MSKPEFWSKNLEFDLYAKLSYMPQSMVTTNIKFAIISFSLFCGWFSSEHFGSLPSLTAKGNGIKS